MVLGEEEGFRREHPGLFYPGGLPAWVSGVLPGNVHDLAAAREMVLPVLREYTGRCRAWPIAGTKAQVTESSRR